MNAAISEIVSVMKRSLLQKKLLVKIVEMDKTRV